MWRIAKPDDDEKIIRMCLQLNEEDPGDQPVLQEQVKKTLECFRSKPWRGRAVVCEVEEETVGYSLLVSFWSNEFGGEVCWIDELYIESGYRSNGYGSALLDILEGEHTLWANHCAAICLEVYPANKRAETLFLKRGFRPAGKTMYRRL